MEASVKACPCPLTNRRSRPYHGDDDAEASSDQIMPTSTADEAAAAHWTELPADLLHDVSRSLHTATEYVSFHAVCKPWRDTASCRPSLLPWLVTPPDALGRRTARCVFSSSRGARDRRRWLLRAEDCTAASRLTNSSCVVGDPLALYAGAAPLPPIFSGDDDEIKWRAEPENHAIGTVSSDGTIVLCQFRLDERTYNQQTRFSLSFSLLRPGDAAWTSVGKSLKTTTSHERGRCSIAYHGGKIVLSFGWAAFCIAATPSSSLAKDSHGTWWMPGPHIRSGYVLESTYVFEFSGELLCAIVEAKSLIFRPVSELANDLSVSLYALLEVELAGKPRWVRRDGLSFADRILFLGLPTSFAVDAARFAISDGCAYFVIRGSPSEWFGIGTVKTCFLFKYSFRDDKSEFIELLPDEWDSDECMWLTPLPDIAPTGVPTT